MLKAAEDAVIPQADADMNSTAKPSHAIRPHPSSHRLDIDCNLQAGVSATTTITTRLLTIGLLLLLLLPPLLLPS